MADMPLYNPLWLLLGKETNFTSGQLSKNARYASVGIVFTADRNPSFSESWAGERNGGSRGVVYPASCVLRPISGRPRGSRSRGALATWIRRFLGIEAWLRSGEGDTTPVSHLLRLPRYSILMSFAQASQANDGDDQCNQSAEVSSIMNRGDFDESGTINDIEVLAK